MTALDRLLRPASVAVVGASADPAKMTGRPVGYLQAHGFPGRIYPVNPRAHTIAGLPCYPDARSLPEPPDAALVLVGPDRVEAALRDLAAIGTGAAIVLAGGYGETGEDGARRQQALKQAAGTMRLLGPNTIGLVNRTDGVMLSASGALEVAELPAGGVSIVSQSGGILGALLSRAADRGIGLAKLVATGNEADLEVTDIILHLLDDPATRVIAVYLEGLRRPDAFRAAAEQARRAGIPLVVYKVGRSESGARSASSHTGALAGSDKVYGALFRQLGVIRAETFADLLDIPAALAAGRRMRGRRVAVLTSTGGAGTLVADSCGLAGFDLPPPGPAAAAVLGGMLDDPGAGARNPVDVTLAGVQPAVMLGAMRAILADPGLDALVTVVGSSALARPDLVADAAAEAFSGTDKPVLAYVSPHAPRVLRALNGRGIPAFATPESFGAVLDALQDRATPTPMPLPRSTITLEGLPCGTLDEARSKALFARAGIPVPREAVAADGAQAAALAAHLGGGPVVLKALSARIAHKSDVGGVEIGVEPSALPAACAAMLARIDAAGAPAPDGFLMQEWVRGGVEMILGCHRDPQLGPVLLLGMGGTAAELIGDVALRLLPLDRAHPASMLEDLRTAPLLRGYRGAPACDVAALIEAVAAFAGLAAALGERLVEAEINPLIVLAEGQGVRAVDGLVVLR